MQNESPGRTIQATALVHEAYLRLIDMTNVDWQHRAHFFAVSARIMRTAQRDARSEAKPTSISCWTNRRTGDRIMHRAHTMTLACAITAAASVNAAKR